MKKVAYLLKSVVTLCILIVLVAMAFLNRDFLWKQTKVARAFYFVWQGDENIKANNFQAAIDYYKKALKIYPEHAKAHYNLGNIYFWYEVYTASPVKKPIKTYRYNEDLKKFVLEIEPPDETEDTENSAEAAYLKATEVDPNYINAWLNLGLVRYNKYDLDGAIRAFMKAINANPMAVDIPFLFNNEASIKFNRAVAFYNLARVYDQMATSTDFGDLRTSYLVQATRYYLKSLAINTNSFDSNYNLALTYQMLGRPTPSIKHYCSSIKLDPFKYSAHYNLGVLLKNQERFTASASELKKAAMLVDVGNDPKKAEYIFRILNDVSFRAAAKELSKVKYFNTHYYPIPTKGIISDVIGKPLLEEKEKLKLKEETEEENIEHQETLTSYDSAVKYFAACVTDVDYYEKEKLKYEVKPQWINVSNEWAQQLVEISKESPPEG